ncbi:SDR family NAD(P)-dependent oxidoreductase [Halobacillus salinarum]|uniref:SDR family NAD(P)-dependent oxidoreductase n=1 Tax=Halobacillus salinarum TaxID=2932257 RepID=A0ABY4EP34_9BACI|nr:SDR family NAD(P)-dependent oxidoreductase [Halobacillus salinarum]UOQ46223.1 SDR family NAD(P)-dependent oxidoreductase [Halobacillus salinarum]
MNFSGHTILITGGGSGIGLALAERYLAAGNEVIIAGRTKDKLEEARHQHPGLHIKTCDVAKEEDRIELFTWITTHFPEVNILINNAGIQERFQLLKDTDDWKRAKNELKINVDGPVHLTMLFAPFFKEKEEAAIINVSSGLALSPGAWVPVYSATKAALHSFTQTLRLQLENTNIEVIEIFPPAVNTDLGGPGMHTFGANLQEFADSVFAEIEEGETEIGYGDSVHRLKADRESLKAGSKQAWEKFKQNNPGF